MNEINTNRTQKFVTTLLVSLLTLAIYISIAGLIKKYIFRDGFYIDFSSISLLDIVIIYWLTTQIIHLWVVEYSEKYDVFSGCGKIDYILYSSGLNVLWMSVLYGAIRHFAFGLDFFPKTLLEFKQGDYLATLFIILNILNPIGTILYVSAINQSEEENLSKIRFSQQSLHSFYTFFLMSFFYGSHLKTKS